MDPDKIVLMIGLMAAFCTTFAFLPQSLHTIKTRHTKDLSLPTLLMLTFGNISWLTYGILINDIPIIAANTISIMFIFTTLVLKLKYK